MKNLLPKRIRWLAGFGRKELIVVIACVALLALLFVSWRARSLDMPRRKVCQQNLKQLLMGFDSYFTATKHLPWAARNDSTNAQDWIFWQPNRTLDQSALAEYTPDFLTILRCPSDRQFSYRGYPYSYSMNGHLEKRSANEIPGNKELILLYEEELPDDGSCGVPNDALASRHIRHSDAGFLDGHVETITQRIGTSPKHFQP